MKDSFFIFLVIMCMLSSGCGKDGPERAVVSGTVTYQGEPVKEGVIRLVPTPGTNAPVTAALIREVATR